MAKNLKMYQVSNISKIDKTLYNDGDVLVTEKGMYMFMKGKAESLHTKTDVIAFMKEEIQKMNFATKEEVSQMIEESKGGV